MSHPVHNQRGFALLSVFMLLLLGLALGAATMLFTLLDFKSTQHFATGNQALAASESGIFDAINTINTRGVVNVANEVVNGGLIPTATTTMNNYSNVNYQLSIVSGTNTATDAILTSTGTQTSLSAQRIIKVNLQRDKLRGGPGALHLSNDVASGSFAGNSMTVDGNNWNVTFMDANSTTAVLDPSVATHPAISTRNDTVSTQVVSSLAGQGTITGLGSPPSVYTTASASTADLLKIANDILSANGASSGCNRTTGGKEYWLPGPCGSGPPSSQCGVHCVKQTNGQGGTSDLWGSYAVPNVTYVQDATAKITGGSYGAGILIFSGDAWFGGSFNFCGWVLFLNPSSNGLVIQGNPTIYGEVLTPLPTFTGGGSITVKYSDNCLTKADAAGIKIVTRWLPIVPSASIARRRAVSLGEVGT